MPSPEVSMMNEWINGLSIDYIICAKIMMITGNLFREKEFGEYEIAYLRTPDILVSLMLNNIFSKANWKFYKIG